MNIAVGFACLVTVAIFIGENVADTQTCLCAYNPSKKGCKIRSPIQVVANHVCQCKIKDRSADNPECTGKYVGCYDTSNKNCTSSLNTYGHCMQGNYRGHGDCCGYVIANKSECLNNVRGLTQNTRLFGPVNLVGGALGAIGGALGGAQQGFQQRPPGFNQGFQQGPPGFNQGYQQRPPGFNQGFHGQGGGFQGGFGLGGFPGGVGVGVNPIGASGSTSCRRWCRTPQGQAYCCENANEPLSAAVTKPGQCPPVRPQCPPTRIHAPTTCSSDGGCAGYNKCCFDTCLQHHTCKPPIGLGK